MNVVESQMWEVVEVLYVTPRKITIKIKHGPINDYRVKGYSPKAKMGFVYKSDIMDQLKKSNKISFELINPDAKKSQWISVEINGKRYLKKDCFEPTNTVVKLEKSTEPSISKGIDIEIIEESVFDQFIPTKTENKKEIIIKKEKIEFENFEEFKNSQIKDLVWIDNKPVILVPCELIKSLRERFAEKIVEAKGPKSGLYNGRTVQQAIEDATIGKVNEYAMWHLLNEIHKFAGHEQKICAPNIKLHSGGDIVDLMFNGKRIDCKFKTNGRCDEANSKVDYTIIGSGDGKKITEDLGYNIHVLFGRTKDNKHLYMPELIENLILIAKENKKII